MELIQDNAVNDKADRAVTGHDLCIRCSTQIATITVRSDRLCKECFMKYVQTKITKKMETFRVRNVAPDAQRVLLVPVSLGVSSIALLHNLDLMLDRQTKRTGRVGFTLHVVHVSTANSPGIEKTEEFMNYLRTEYPRYIYSHVQLVENDEAADTASEFNTNIRFDNLKSVTSRADMLEVVKISKIVSEAKRIKCEGILWGDTTTRLAEKVLAQTAKGRGFALPWQVNDGDTPHGIKFHYPLKDLLKKEIISYAGFVPLRSFDSETISSIPRTAVSAKNTTIDELMQEYFRSLEESFPSIVANVVRTSSKLQAPSIEGFRSCAICEMPVAADDPGLLQWEGNHQQGLPNTELDDLTQYCYGCARSISVKQ